jgi:hypothetical protein
MRRLRPCPRAVLLCAGFVRDWGITALREVVSCVL